MLSSLDIFAFTRVTVPRTASLLFHSAVMVNLVPEVSGFPGMATSVTRARNKSTRHFLMALLPNFISDPDGCCAEGAYPRRHSSQVEKMVARSERRGSGKLVECTASTKQTAPADKHVRRCQHCISPTDLHAHHLVRRRQTRRRCIGQRDHTR